MLQNLERSLQHIAKQIPFVRTYGRAYQARAYGFLQDLVPLIRKHDRLVFLGTLATFVAWITLFSQEERPSAPPSSLVHVAEVQRRSAQETISFLGTFVSRYSGVIASRIAGPVESMPIDVGDRVAKGDVLIHITPRQMKAMERLAAAQVAEAQAALKSSISSLALSQRKLGRLNELKGSAAFSSARQEDAQLEQERMQSTLDEAEARLLRAEAQHESAKLDLEWSQLQAPYSGVITERHTQAGAWLKVGDPIVSMTNDSHIEIEVHIPTQYATNITEDMTLSYGRGQAGNPDYARNPASLRALLPQENSLTRTRTARLVPQPMPAHITVGETVNVYVPTSPKNDALLIPKDALLFNNNTYMVFVVNDKQQATPRTITIGDAQDQYYEVTSGLQEHELVVVRGNERLRPGQPVHIQNTTARKEQP
ncbi:MAG: efflux RND transporter periplasmic adaptor subunit [Alphaproteobacteria bacterium GM202ARS2]|nr:efflux RND transporter periplasmic adaptor subunit [Alphaproteobacteria bacterium GM202ARS2]